MDGKPGVSARPASLPDVLAIHNKSDTVCAVECKSGMSASLSVPADQVARCMEIVDDLRAYKNRLTILAFKFAGKKGGRKLLCRSLLWDGRSPDDVRCSYDGTVRIGGKIDSLEWVGMF